MTQEINYSYHIRLANVAKNEGTTIEGLAAWKDSELLRISGFGRRSLAYLRKAYPLPPGTIHCPHCGGPIVPAISDAQRERSP